ncbi:MAG: undecaprenyl-phosphate glucose phosphotransferase, partial [Krumholzibacteria bacterium]|nr:undecaprenyl-phosphate glucose phosphotransferase [Candidatus Krumholzibacteria bacterium]
GRGHLIEALVLVAVDMVMLQSAFLATYWFRFHSGIWLVPLGIPPFGMYLAAGLVVLGVFFGILYAGGMYTGRGGRSFEDDLVGLFKGVALGSLLVLALAFFLRGETYSRSFFGLFVLSSFVFLATGRVLARVLLRSVQTRGVGTTRVLLVGTSPMRHRLLRAFRRLPGLALKPVGWVRVPGDREPGTGDGEAAEASVLDADGRRRSAPPGSPLPCLGEVGELRAVVLEHGIDLVVLTVPFDQLPLVGQVAAELSNLNVDLQFVPDLLSLHTSRMRLKEIAGIPFISVREESLSGVDRLVKRTFDLLASGLGLLVLAPLLVVLALLVRLSSPGPVFYRQERVGRDGHEFAMIKFRTMRPDAEAASGPVWTTAQDPRVTGIGRFLRRTSLDELPQLWNVLLGDMSLVGPRPERRVFVEQFSRSTPRYFERHRVQSGLTGWAQVHGLRGNTSIEERTLYDLHYVENWSLLLDVRILLMTIHHVLRGENAY